MNVVVCIINPPDRNAIELGLSLTADRPGRITVVSMGPPDARPALEEALAMGADAAILISDRVFAGADSLATAHALAGTINKFCRFDLVLCGNETIDSGTAQVGPQLAEFLDIPHVTNVRGVEFQDGDRLMITRALENGFVRVRVSLPALLTVTRQINEPRVPTVMGIIGEASKSFRVIGAREAGLDPRQVGLAGSPTQMGEATVESEVTRKHEVFRGEPAEAVHKALARLRDMRALDDRLFRAETLEVVEQAEPRPIEEAETVIGVGWGAYSLGNLKMVEELAGVLGAAIGGTRPLVDKGWIPPEHMIGQSGRIVSPKLFISLGASGAMHFTTGFQRAGLVLAVDQNPEAPIFKAADIGIVGDLRRVLPLLIEGFRNKLGRAVCDRH